MKDENHLEQHEAMDIILKYLVDKISESPIHSETIWKNLFPEQDEEVVYFILKKIIDTVDTIVISHIRNDNIDNFDVFFEANAITKRFLIDQGGFTKQFEDKQVETQMQNHISKLNYEKLMAEVDIIKFQKGLGKKITIWGFIFLALSVLTSILTTFIQNQSKEDFAPKIEYLKNQNDSLKSNIFKIEKRLNATEKLVNPN